MFPIKHFTIPLLANDKKSTVAFYESIGFKLFPNNTLRLVGASISLSLYEGKDRRGLRHSFFYSQ